MFRARSRRHGFTLIELLIVVVIIGVLAAISIPKFATTKEKAYVGTLKSDLRNLATAEEAYYYDMSDYTVDLALLNFTPSSSVVITVAEATPAGWSATAAAPSATTKTCAVFFGNAAAVAPATNAGIITCD